MKKLTTNKLTISVVSLITMVITILLMALPVCMFTYREYIDYYATAEINIRVSDSLFDFLGVKSNIIGTYKDYQWAIKLMTAFAYLQFLAAIISSVLIVIFLLFGDEKAAKRVNLSLQIINLFFVFINTLLGIIYTGIVGEKFEDFKNLFTMSWMPLLIVGALFAIFIVAYKKISVCGLNEDNVSGYAEAPKVAPEVKEEERVNEDKNVIGTQSSDMGNIELLIKYKELMDSGVISQEEFECKKKSIL